MAATGKQIPALDGLRGIAILLVMFDHFGPPGFHLAFIDKVLFAGSRLGYIGVDLFFVLSGFLITGILLDTRDCPNYWSSFYFRRALRIFPLYYAFLLFAWAVFPRTADPDWLPVRADWWLYPSYLSNWLVLHKGPWSNIVGHFWSLAVEEQFYFVWPWVVLFIRPRQLPWLLVGSEVLLIWARSWWVFRYGYTDQAGLARIDGLLLGALAAIIVRTVDFSPFVKTVLPFLAVPPLAAFFAVGTLFLRRVGIPALAGKFFEVARFPILAIGFALLLLAAATTNGGRTWLQSVLNQRPLRQTGKIAYGLYVYHVPLAFFLRKWKLAQSSLILSDVRILIAFSLSYAVAILSYNYFEKRFLQLKDKFRAKSEPIHRTAMASV